MALNQYIKETIPEAFVLGADKMNEYKTPAPSEPVFYCRLEGVEKSRETNTVAWDGRQDCCPCFMSSGRFAAEMGDGISERSISGWRSRNAG